MRPHSHVWTRLLLLLLSLYLVTSSSALISRREVASSEEGIKLANEVSDSSNKNTPSVSSSQSSTNKKVIGDGVGTKDAPVDGKDGRPHSGPFVETNAERDRKKAKENGDDISKPANKEVSRAKDGTKTLAGGDDGKKLPESNDGVMDDPNRRGPREGTRGTEGGISEKTKDSKEENKDSTEKIPDPPKEAPPLPHSEQEKVDKVTAKTAKEEEKKSSKEATPTDKDKKKDDSLQKDETVGLQKPEDLPKKPHDIPPPLPPTSSNSDPLAILKPYTDAFPSFSTAGAPGLIQPLHSFLLSLTMIIFSEIGDKTFLIAALMAMKNPRLVVFTAAFAALIAMTVLSAVLGHAVPQLVPKKLVNWAAAFMFLVFGAKMLREGYAMRPEQGVSEEMREVEMELEEKEELARKMNRRGSQALSPFILEGGRMMNSRKSRSNTRLPAPADSPPSPDSRSPSPMSARTSVSNALSGVNNLLSLLLSPAWVQTFVMTFLGEWGDRSQISTIAMAAGQDYWWVTIGAVSGHGVCTAMAVVGGRAIAGRVSLRIVTLGGGFTFLAFGVIYLFEAAYLAS